jgi:hypothetical protein
MKTGLRSLALFTIGLVMVASLCWAASTDKYLKELKSEDPDVRANAAYELGCG